MAGHRQVRDPYAGAGLGRCRVCGHRCRPGTSSHAACRAAQRDKRQHRRAALERTGERCAIPGCRNPGPFESAHVVDLVDNGPHDYTRLLCRPHHAAETRERGAARRRRKDTMPATAKPKTKGKPKGPKPSTVRLRLAAGALMVAVPAAALAPVPWAEVAGWGPTAAGVAVALVLTWWVGRRTLRARRARAAAERARIVDFVAYETRTAPDALTVAVSRWEKVPGERERRPAAGWAVYAPTFNDRDGSQDRERFEDAMRRKTGQPGLTFTWRPDRDRVEWQTGEEPPPVPEAGPAPAGPDTARVARIVRRVESELRAYMKSDTVTVRADGPGDAIGPTALTVTYPEGFRDDSDEPRATALARVNAKVPGRWKPTWDTQANTVRLVRRPDLPSRVPRPPADGDPWRLAVGIDDHHDPVVWDLRVAPHMLVAGETGSGKSVVLRGLMVDAAARGFTVLAVDPKRIELTGLRTWPGVEQIESSVEGMVDLVERVHDDMDARYARIESADVDPDELRPVLLVVDEAKEWLDRVSAHWRATKTGSGGGSEHPVVEKWRSIARLGRSARVHLLVGIQRPDAKDFGGESRDNYGARLALGSLSEQGARMMFGRSDVGRDVPASAKGRATADLAGRIAEVQTYWTPDPGKRLSAEDREVLAALRPPPEHGPPVESAGAPTLFEPEPAQEPEPERPRRRRELLRAGDDGFADRLPVRLGLGDGSTVLVTEAVPAPGREETHAELTVSDGSSSWVTEVEYREPLAVMD